MMSPAEQEKLFGVLRIAHQKWSPRFCSGYVHGAQDEQFRTKPKRDQLLMAEALDDYGLGYLMGFAMRRGPDAEIEPWFGLIGLLVEDARGEAQGS